MKKTFKRLVFITLLVAFFSGVNSIALAGVAAPPLPTVNVTEWMTPLDPVADGQYGISILSNGANSAGEEWYVHWFAVENPDANNSWANRTGWLSRIMTDAQMESYLISNMQWPGPYPETGVNVIQYYNFNGTNIGPNEYEDEFYWNSSGILSHFWAGLTLVSNLPEDEFTAMIVHGEAENLDQQPIPEPTTLFLLGTGLAGIGAVRRKRANKT